MPSIPPILTPSAATLRYEPLHAFLDGTPLPIPLPDDVRDAVWDLTDEVGRKRSSSGAERYAADALRVALVATPAAEMMLETVREALLPIESALARIEREVGALQAAEARTARRQDILAARQTNTLRGTTRAWELVPSLYSASEPPRLVRSYDALAILSDEHLRDLATYYAGEARDTTSRAECVVEVCEALGVPCPTEDVVMREPRRAKREREPEDAGEGPEGEGGRREGEREGEGGEIAVDPKPRILPEVDMTPPPRPRRRSRAADELQVLAERRKEDARRPSRTLDDEPPPMRRRKVSGHKVCK